MSTVSRIPAFQANSNSSGGDGDDSSRSQDVSTVRESSAMCTQPTTTEPSNCSYLNSVGEKRDLLILVDGEANCGFDEVSGVQSPCKRKKITTEENITCNAQRSTSEQPRSRYLPQFSIDYLQKWISENSLYPRKAEKVSIMMATGLTANQVGDWFREARRKQRKRDSLQPTIMEKAPTNVAVANTSNFPVENNSNVYPSKDELMEIVAATSKQEVDDWYRVKREARESRKKRGLPQISIEYLNQWLVQNPSSVYPTSIQKKEMASETGLTEKQVYDWFREVRRKKRKASEGTALKGRPNRHGLPQPSANYLNNWFAEHSLNPFPTKAEKEDIILATGLTEYQVDNWFKEARRKQREANAADLAKIEATAV